MITRLCRLSRIALMREIGVRRLLETSLSSFGPCLKALFLRGEKDSSEFPGGLYLLDFPAPPFATGRLFRRLDTIVCAYNFLTIAAAKIW